MSARRLDRESLLAALEGGTESSRAALEALLEVSPADRAVLLDLELARRLVRLLGDESRTYQRQAADGVRALSGEHPMLARALEEALAAPEPRLRWGAAYTLGHAAPVPPLAIWPSVRETLALADGDQRWAAAELACELARHHSSVLDELRAELEADSPTARKMALYCLRDLAVPELARFGRERLHDPDSGVRLAALSAITRGEECEPELVASAVAVTELVERDPDPGVRRSAAVALGRLGVAAPEVLAALRRAEQGDDESLTRAARAALARLAGSN